MSRGEGAGVALDLQPLPDGQPIAGKELPSLAFTVYWQRLLDTLIAYEGEQDATIARIRRINSHTQPTTIMTATDNGTTATITVAEHTRVYGDGTTLAVAGGSQAGLTSDATYAVYYDDATLSSPTPVYVFTTVLADAQATKGTGRHFCGVISTPPAGTAQSRTGGGVYAIGSNVGGEL